MSDVPLSALFGLLAVLIVVSAFTSASETALMSLNRYRLRHLVNAGHRGARIADRLLQRPDRLLGLILLGNNFVNIFSASIATIIALRLGGESAIAAATGLLTLVILIFGETAPKTMGALHPERVAFPAAYLLAPLQKLLYPLVWIVNVMANGVLRLFGVRADEAGTSSLSREELRTIVNEAGAMIPRRHQKMLLSILDLEKATVEDIMIPRNEVVGIDLEDDWDTIVEQLSGSQYTRLPVYRGAVDDVQGILHVRRILPALLRGDLAPDDLTGSMSEAYFVPEGTPLNVQLLNFQARRRRIGLVVDEYGDIMGLVTLEDILEEIVGEFTTDPAATMHEVQPQEDGSFLVEGSVSIRELNRLLSWNMPTDGPKTLNGLILEHMETIPKPGTSFLLSDYPVTIVQTQGNRVRLARVQPRRKRRRRT